MTVIHHPLATEKSIRMMESDNKLIFLVDRKATKQDIKEEIEERFDAKVSKVNTLITFKGKKAIVTFTQDTPAIDVATKLGLM